MPNSPSRPHEKNLQNQFGLRAGNFNRSAHWITDPALAQAHVDAAGKPLGKALEMCCGTGITGRALKAAGWDVTGLDITPEMVAEAGKHFKAVQGSVEATPFEAASFDLVAMRQAYFLLGNGPAALKEVKRLLKPGGRFVLSQTVPFNETDTDWLRKVHETKQHQMTRFFTGNDLQQELESHGFEVTRRHELRVRESVTLWMNNAPEMEPERRKAVCELVLNAPESYRKLRKVELANGEILEDWNWVVLTARAK